MLLSELEYLDDDLKAFVNLWQTLPRSKNALIPCRRELSPGVAAALMPRMGIAEMQGPKRLILTYYGSELERMSGMQITGANYYDLIPPEDQDDTIAFHKAFFGFPCGAFMESRLTTRAGSSYLLKLIQLPFADNDTGEARFLTYVAGAKKPLHDRSDARNEELRNSWIKNLNYIDIGAGCPPHAIQNYHRRSPGRAGR